MITALVLFWGSLLLVFWAYFGYFLALKSISLFFTRKIAKADYFPGVSLLITAHNEEKRIEEKIKNTLALNYPKDKMQIIVISDGSTDRTVEIAGSFREMGVELLEIPTRHGKHYGQGEGIKIARNDIVVLTDATTFLETNSLKNIVANFADRTVGCVSGLDMIQNSHNGPSGEGAYVKYEMKLRDLESQVGSLVGASGSFYALRKSLAGIWYPDMSNDFYLPIIARMNNYRTILDKTAVGYYNIIEDPQREFQRKVRTVVHGIDVLVKFRSILNPFRYGFFAFQMASHKLFRWLVPFALILIFCSNLFLYKDSPFYLTMLVCQLLFYLLTVSAYFIRSLQHKVLFKVPYFFVMANYSILVAWIDFLKGERYITWQATER